MHHGQLAQLKVVSDAKLPAKVSYVLDFLMSKLLLAKRVAFDIFLLFKAIDKDENKFTLSVLATNKSKIDIRGVPISDTEARLPTKKWEKHVRSPMAKLYLRVAIYIEYVTTVREQGASLHGLANVFSTA